MRVAVAGKVGPNAILQTDAALVSLVGEDLADRVFTVAGLLPMRRDPPSDMVAQEDAARLHRAVAATLPPDDAARVAREAGERTGHYILAHRIPGPAQRILRLLPAWAAGPVLLRAIRAHAWTFAGTAEVETENGPPMRVVIRENPLALPGCAWHCAVFETLFRALVHPDARVRHVTCHAQGGDACVFEIDRRHR